MSKPPSFPLAVVDARVFPSGCTSLIAITASVGSFVGAAPATDDEVLEAYQLCSRLEGIIPALESTHALVHGIKRAKGLAKDKIVIVNLSGRGDKDVQQVQRLLDQKA